MPLNRSDLTNALLPAVKGIFHDAYTTRVKSLLYPEIASVVPSDSDEENYAWIGSVPGMREWTGSRLLKTTSNDDYTLTNKTYESTLEIERTAIEDNKLGMIQSRVRAYGMEAARHTEYLVFDQLKEGDTLLAYDGAAFFANRGTNQNNLGSTALSEDALSTAIATMMKFIDEEGKPYGVMPNLLVVPPNLWLLGRKLTESPVNVGTTQTDALNVLAKIGLSCITSPYLTDTTDWFLLDTTMACKPIILQQRTAVELTALEQNSEAGFMYDKYLYGIRERKAVGYGPWWTAFGAIVTGG
jgi:phage major head subunit gpT-like protein